MEYPHTSDIWLRDAGFSDYCASYPIKGNKTSLLASRKQGSVTHLLLRQLNPRLKGNKTTFSSSLLVQTIHKGLNESCTVKKSFKSPFFVSTACSMLKSTWWPSKSGLFCHKVINLENLKYIFFCRTSQHWWDKNLTVPCSRIISLLLTYFVLLPTDRNRTSI